jgi:hypothetical protein
MIVTAKSKPRAMDDLASAHSIVWLLRLRVNEPGVLSGQNQRQWWQHLAPKVMHRRLRDVEVLLREWCRSDYGTQWLRVARQEGGVTGAARGRKQQPELATDGVGF